MPNVEACDGPWCVCRRLVVGLASGGQTSTMRVAELDGIDRVTLTGLVAEVLLERYGVEHGVYPPDELAADCELAVESIVSTAAEFPAGSVLELVARRAADGRVDVEPGLRESLPA